MNDKIFFAPSDKFSIRTSDFVAHRIKYGLSQHAILTITLNQHKNLGEYEEISKSVSSGLFSRSESSTHKKDAREMQVEYWSNEELKKDLDALKEALK